MWTCETCWPAHSKLCRHCHWRWLAVVESVLYCCSVKNHLYSLFCHKVVCVLESCYSWTWYLSLNCHWHYQCYSIARCSLLLVRNNIKYTLVTIVHLSFVYSAVKTIFSQSRLISWPYTPVPSHLSAGSLVRNCTQFRRLGLGYVRVRIGDGVRARVRVSVRFSGANDSFAGATEPADKWLWTNTPRVRGCCPIHSSPQRL